MIDIVQFYNDCKDEYTESIRRCNPCYDEMITSMISYFHPWTPLDILELGCGTGNLTLLMCERFPEASISAIDIAQGNLDVCRDRLGKHTVELICDDLRQVEYEPGSFDLVISSLALHHLEDEERADLYKAVYGWLRPRGRFVFCDRYRDESTQIYLLNRQIWKEKAFAQGTSEEEWAKWMKHESEDDHPGFLLQQIKYLKIAGFNVSEVLWRKYLWASVLAQKY